MCVSSAPAIFKGTKGYIGEKNHPLHGKIHVMAYQNQAKNLSSEVNSLILPFPSREKMSEKNSLDVSKDKSFLNKMVERAFENPYGTVSNSMQKSVSDKAVVFQQGIYTIILSPSADRVFESLMELEEIKRPSIKKELLEWYEKFYPGHTIALCIFSNHELSESEPLLWWYKPMNEEILFFPAMDSHTGFAPKRGELVRMDHKLILGSDYFLSDKKEIKASLSFGSIVESLKDKIFHLDEKKHQDYSHLGLFLDQQSSLMPSSFALDDLNKYYQNKDLADFLATEFFGARFLGEAMNGDFNISKKDLRSKKKEKILRTSPRNY